MKKQYTKTHGYNITIILISLAMLILFVLIGKCSTTSETSQLDEMRSYHADKGLTQIDNGYLIIKK